MLCFAIAFLGGDLILQFFSMLPSRVWAEASFIVGIFIYSLKSLPSFTKTVLLGMLLGFAWSLWCATSLASFSLPKEWEEAPVVLRGQIASLPQDRGQQSGFLFRLNDSPRGLLRLSWRNPPVKLRVGDEWQLPVRLKRIHGNLNPGGFDYEAWAFQNGIRGSGYVLGKAKATLLKPARAIQGIDSFRQRVLEKATLLMPHTQTSPWLLAFLVGERSGIPPSEWEVLRNTGTNHLMAIAGLHIGFLAGLVFILVGFIWRRVPALLLLLPSCQASACASLVLALLYSALAGFSIPTQRASIMISIFLLTSLARRVIPAWQAFSVALLLVLLLNPLSVLSSSFWLSFTTIALILYGMNGRVGVHSFWWKWGRPQWVIALGLLPLSLWIFSQYSLVSFFANALAIPWVGFVILPLCFLSLPLLFLAPGLAQIILTWADHCLAVLWIILSWFSHFSWATWQQSLPHYGFLFSSFCGILLLLAPRGFPGKYLGLCWLLPVLFFKPAPPRQGEARFTLLDVGQGLSAVVQTAHHTLVFDTGDKAEAVVLPFLHSQGISKLDLLMISHGDKDHSGGADAVLRQMPVSTVLTSEPLIFLQLKVGYCLAGTSWEWDGVRFSIISPTLETLGQGNNSSCVLRVSTAKASLLLPGDIELEAEKFLVTQANALLPTDILVAPHHGSKTSGLQAFVGRVHPQYVLYATGYRNRFHFPHEKITELYAKLGTVEYNTVNTGALQFTLGEKALSPPACYRWQRKRYWFAE